MKTSSKIFLMMVVLIVSGVIWMGITKKNEIVLIANPKVLAIKIIDNQEPMVDLKDQKEIAYGSSPEILNNTDYTKLRKTVYEKLKEAQNMLPKGLHFCVYEAYRSLDLQQMEFTNRFEKVKNQYPNWSHKKIFTEATKLVSPIINLDGTKNIPPHSTGGAIDIYLINDKGIPVDMGIHPKDWMQDDGSISLTLSQKISTEAQKYRKIMHEVLLRVGFVNYPTEYWHWSYGDRYWAYHQNKSHAIYGSYHKDN